MAALGVTKIWLPADNTTDNEADQQILKNSGYVSIQLHSANYFAKGNWWQKKFGGRDKITLVTSVEYESSKEKISAVSVQDVREVRPDQSSNLGLQKNIVLKVPVNCDGIGIEARLFAVKNDTLQEKFEMLNTPEFQTALQLAPGIVGQIISISSLIKKLFTDPGMHAQLNVNYAGIVSAQKIQKPVSQGKLTSGLLVLIDTNNGNPFTDPDEKKFQLKGDRLYYEGKQVENTYVIFNISFDSVRSDDENTSWFKKFSGGLKKLDDIRTSSRDEYGRIYLDALNLWKEGNALLSEDVNYIAREKEMIEAAAFTAIEDKFSKLVPPAPPPPGDAEKEITIGPQIPLKDFPKFSIDGADLMSYDPTGVKPMLRFGKSGFGSFGFNEISIEVSPFDEDNVSRMKQMSESYLVELRKHSLELHLLPKNSLPNVNRVKGAQ